MNNQQLNSPQFDPNNFGQNKVKLTTILQSFLTNFLNFSGRASRKEFWYPTLTYYIAIIVLILLVGISAALTFSSTVSSFNNNDYFGGLDSALDGISTIGSMIGVYLSFAVYSIIFSIGYFSAHVRRLRDVGFSNKGILTIYVIYYILVIFSGFALSLIWSLLMYIVLPLLPTNQLETNNNDGFSTFMFSQNPQAAAYYASQGNPGFGYNPNINGQGFNQTPVNNGQVTQQNFNQNPVNNGQVTQHAQQSFNQVPVQPAAPVNNKPLAQETTVKKEELVTQASVQEPVKVEVPNVETTKTETPKVEKTQPVNPFGDQVFKK